MPELSPEQERDLAEFLTRLAAFCMKETTVCPYPDCNQEVESMEKVGRCVYLRPCNHRLWNGDIPEAWEK